MLKSLSVPLKLSSRWLSQSRRSLLTLAIETSWYRSPTQSCNLYAKEKLSDDTSVAILETHGNQADLHFYETLTADNSASRGVEPVLTGIQHQQNLSPLLAKSLQSLPEGSSRDGSGTRGLVYQGTNGSRTSKRIPDLVAVTRGPGMNASLASGLECAKAMSVAWQIPLIGVHHMQAHALTPRLVSALNATTNDEAVTPRFPFMSLLVSGGHTLLIYSQDVCQHQIIASTVDVAIGNALDQMARDILPAELLMGKDTSYGKLLENFAVGENSFYGEYSPARTRAEEIVTILSPYGWDLKPPLADSLRLAFSYSGLRSKVQSICQARGASMSLEERRALALLTLKVAFEHLAFKTIIGLKDMHKHGMPITTLVVSGGVASNSFLQHILRTTLDVRGFKDVALIRPPVALCTDNAAMIAWAGAEMYKSGWTTALACTPINKWSIDSTAADGGILGASHWIKWGPGVQLSAVAS